MSWSPNFEDNLSLASDLRPTFEQFEQQENCGLTTLRPKNATLNVDQDVYDFPSDTSTLKTDVEAVLELESYRRKFGLTNKKNERRKWHQQQTGENNEEDTETVEIEIVHVIRASGSEPEPPSTYRPNSKTTYKAAIPIDKLPVAGKKNLFLSPDHFNFENHYFMSKTKPEATVRDVNDVNKTSTNVNYSPNIRDECTAHHKSFIESTVGAPGGQYVSPAQLYATKARRNR